MFFYAAGNEPKQDGFSLAMHYNRNLILFSWLPMLIFDVLGIYYLNIDQHVCSTSPLWIWSLFALVFQVFFFYLVALCTMIKYSFEYYKLHMTMGAVAICSGIISSGAVILFAPEDYTCSNMKSTGLYLWALFAFSVVAIGAIYYIVRFFVELDIIIQSKKKITAESDYLLAQVSVGDPNADPEAQVEGENDETRQPKPCQRPGCDQFGTVLCATCKQVCYCSSACLFTHHKGAHKFECAKLLSAATPNKGLLGNVRPSSYVPHDALKGV